MTVFNGEAHLAEALDSVLSQSMPDFELVVVDDASTDSSPEILAAYKARDSRIRILHNDQNLGPYDSANLALAEIRGPFVARMDADDRCLPDRIERQLRFLEAHLDHLLVGGGYRSIDLGGNPRFIKRNPMNAAQCAWTTCFRMPMVHPGFFFRAKLPDGTPIRYAGGRTIAQDYALASSLARMGKTAVLNGLLVDYRMHSANISSQQYSEQLYAARLIAVGNVDARYPVPIARSLQPFLDVFYRHVPGSGTAMKQAASALSEAIDFDAQEGTLPTRWLRRRAAGLLADAFLGAGPLAHRLSHAASMVIHGRSYLWPLAARLVEIRRLARPLSAEELGAHPAKNVARGK